MFSLVQSKYLTSSIETPYSMQSVADIYLSTMHGVEALFHRPTTIYCNNYIQRPAIKQRTW